MKAGHAALWSGLGLVVGFLAGTILGRKPDVIREGFAANAVVTSESAPLTEEETGSILLTANPQPAREILDSPAKDDPALVQQGQAPTLLDAFEIMKQALSQRVYPPYDSAEFATKYQGISLDEMRAAEVVIRQLMTEESDRISESLFSAGRYEVQIVRAGETVKTPHSTPDNPIASYGYRIEQHDGFSRVMIAPIPPGEFPDFDSIKREVRWLGTHIRLQDRE